MTRWEYTTAQFPAVNGWWKDWLDECGRDGWEHSSTHVVTLQNGDGNLAPLQNIVITMKRPIAAPTPMDHMKLTDSIAETVLPRTDQGQKFKIDITKPGEASTVLFGVSSLSLSDADRLQRLFKELLSSVTTEKFIVRVTPEAHPKPLRSPNHKI